MEMRKRAAVVTGAARGIGAAIAERLQYDGMRVSGWDLNANICPHHGLSDWRQVDVSNACAVAEAARDTESVLGGIDVVVNAAGISGSTYPMEDYSYEEWRRVVSINLDSVFLVSRAFIPGMKVRGYGRIINISSVAAKEGNPQMCAYSASKGGVLTLTKALARELATTGILVNCVTPGLIATDLLKDMSEESVALSRSKIPMDRVGQPSEVAALVSWLSGSECSFSTGAVFDISGGRSTY